MNNTPIMKTDVGQGIGTVISLLMLSYLILPLMGVCVFIAFDIADMAKGIDPFWVWSCRAITGTMIWGVFSIVKAIRDSNKVQREQRHPQIVYVYKPSSRE
jgi:hypothetical protein